MEKKMNKRIDADKLMPPNVQKLPETILWEELEMQDDKLIMNPKCRLRTDPEHQKDRIQQIVTGDSGKTMHFDLVPEVQHMSMQMVNCGLTNQEVLFNLCSMKQSVLREYMRCKSEYQQRKSDIIRYDLRNSITPAIQNHIMISLRTTLEQRDMLYQSALSS